MNEFVMAYVALNVVKKNMRDALVSDYRSSEKKHETKKSIWDLF